MINKKKLIFYVVSNSHIRNLELLNKYIFKKKNYLVTVFYEKSLNLIDINNINKEYDFIDINSIDLNIFFKNTKYMFLIMSTAQGRRAPFNLSYNCYLKNIPIIALQETNQAFLHNKNFNNYVLPFDIFFAISSFESKYLKEIDSTLKTIVVGWPYNIDEIHSNNLLNKKKFILCLNASVEINHFSLENKKTQLILISNIIKNVGIENLYIKFHPAESIEYINFFKKKFSKKIFLDNKKNLSFFLDCFDAIISTGFSQSIIESVLLNKNIIIIKLEKDEYYLEKYNSIKILNINNIKDFNLINFITENKKNHSNLIKDHIFLSMQESIDIIDMFISKPIISENSQLKDFKYFLWNEFLHIINKDGITINELNLSKNHYHKNFLQFINNDIINIEQFNKYINQFGNLTIRDILISLIIYKSLMSKKINKFENFKFLNFYPFSKNKYLFFFFIKKFYNSNNLNYNKNLHKEYINKFYSKNYFLTLINLFIKKIFN